MSSAQDIDEIFFMDKLVALIEDDQPVAQAVIGLLESMGAEARCYANAEDALGDAHINQADYFIVDYMLGGKDNGIQFLSSLRRKLGKPIKAVMMTGNTSANFIRTAEMSDWPVVHKPVNISKLISKLRDQDESNV
jgi:DNA-binding response OmpR family regulator